MLLLHKIEKTHFSPSEKEIINYVLRNSDQLDDLSIQTIADATYTSAPIVVRAAKKLGLNGWNELKKQLKSEIEYLYASNEIDASIPFVITDSFVDIANYIAKLEYETINDTLSLISHDLIYKIMSLLRNTKDIDIYIDGNYSFLADEFAKKMRIIDYNVNCALIGNDDYLLATKSDSKHCAIIISYFADNERIYKLCDKLKAKKIKIIAVTSLTENDLLKHADCIVHMSSRELRYTKIGEFSSSTSLKLILDIIYGCIFSTDYEKNLNTRIVVSKEIDNLEIDEESC